MREFLSQRGLTFQERDLFREPLTEAEIRALLAGRSPADLFAWRSRPAREQGLTPERLTPEAMVRLMASDPRFIRRPVVVLDGRLVPGATPQTLARLLAESGSSESGQAVG